SRLDTWINDRPLALPVVPDAVTPVHPAALPPIRPRHIRMHQRECALEISSVERRVAAAQQEFGVGVGAHTGVARGRALPGPALWFFARRSLSLISRVPISRNGLEHAHTVALGVPERDVLSYAGYRHRLAKH